LSQRDADEILVPQYIVHRLMYPIMVLPHNVADVTARMRAGGVLFVQRGNQPQPRMRAISHIAVQQYVPEDGDRLIRRGNKHPLQRPPLPSADDVTLPVQCADGGAPPLCFGDRIYRARDRRLIDPLRSVSWPVLHVGDTVLATPVDGDLVLMNRQPTLVQESMLGMRIRIGPALSFGSTCGPIDALRGDFDGDEINLHLPQGVHVASELRHLLGVPEQVVTGQSGSPVVKPIQDAVATAHWLTQTDPRTHAPPALSSVAFAQIAADIDVPSVHARLAELRRAWDALRADRPDHPLVRATASADVDYLRTGFALFSLCLPADCTFRGREPATARLVNMYRTARRLPKGAVPIDIRHGLFLGGIVTSDTLAGGRGLLNHVYQLHGPAEGVRFLSRLQRLTTIVSLHGYSPSVGLDDCLLPPGVAAVVRDIFGARVRRFRMAAGGDALAAADAAFAGAPYRVDGGDRTEAKVEQLENMRVESEAAVMHFSLGVRRRPGPAADPEGLSFTPMSSVHLNQISLFAMLATKGSVSNYMPRGLPPVGRTRQGPAGAVFAHPRAADDSQHPTAARRLRPRVPVRSEGRPRGRSPEEPRAVVERILLGGTLADRVLHPRHRRPPDHRGGRHQDGRQRLLHAPGRQTYGILHHRIRRHRSRRRPHHPVPVQRNGTGSEAGVRVRMDGEGGGTGGGGSSPRRQFQAGAGNSGAFADLNTVLPEWHERVHRSAAAAAAPTVY
jgi:hypothetical protein